MRINGGDTMLTLTPVTLAAANTFVNAHHRHHKATGRPLLADPDWGTKIAAGKACDIRRCTHLHQGACYIHSLF